jgi:hypothetical protein
MPQLQAADVIFTLMIGSLVLVLTFLTFREEKLRSSGK